VGCWRGYLSVARCRLAYDPADATATASVKSRLVLPFWYWLTWVVPEKGPLNGCVCVCVCVCARARALTLLVEHQEEHLACKKLRCWCGYLSGGRCRLFAYGPADSLHPKNPSSLTSFKSRLVLFFFVSGLSRLPWKRGC